MVDGERCERPVEKKKPVYLFNIWEPKNKQMWKEWESREVSWRGRRGQVQEQRENLRWIYWVGREAYVERERTDGSVSWIKKKRFQLSDFWCFLSGLFFMPPFKTCIKTGGRERTSISTCLQYIPSKLRNIYRKCSHFVATQQPPIQGCSFFTLLCFLLSREWRWRGGSSWKPVKHYEPVCLSFLSVYGMDIYICCSAQLPNTSLCQSTSQSAMDTGLHLVDEYIFKYTNNPIIGSSQFIAIFQMQTGMSWSALCPHLDISFSYWHSILLTFYLIFMFSQ